MEETSSTANTKSDDCVGPGKTFAGRDSSAVHVQQGASGTQSKRTDKTRQEKDSASEHRWTPEEAEIHKKLRSTLKSKFQQLVEGVPNQGDPRLLQEIYTDLYVTEGGRGGWVNDEHEVRQIEEVCDMSDYSDDESDGGGGVNDEHEVSQIEGAFDMSDDSDDESDGGGGVNDEHEVRQIERASWRREEQDRPIECSDIFNRLLEEERRRKEHFLEEERRISEPFHRQHKPLRTVLTKGVAGIGKTVSVQKFILDWAEGTANQEVHFIFPLPFRELNLMKEDKLSLVDLIQHFFPEIKDSRIFSSSDHRVMFIFDGLDECRLPLNFLSNPRCCDVTEPASVDVLLTNLIKGNLLPSALLWITTRPAAANQIPSKCVAQVTEIRGFNDPQKDEYFRKRISDENLASRTITHLKSSRSLYIMCHIPVFCWITATVVEKTSESEKVKMPRTLTQMYTHFLMMQTGMKHVKYTERKETDEEVIFKLGKLAFQQLEKGNLIFYEEDLRECGIDVTEASVYSGVCTQIFREEAGLCHGRVFSFVHLSIQEFLAALYVFLCFSNRQRNMPDQQQTSQLSALFRAATLHDLHKTAVDLALQSKNGHLDLFLRFLLGLSLESNQNLLKHLLPQSSNQSDSSEKTVQCVKQKIRDQRSSDRRINLFYCLNELNHHAVVEHKMNSEDLHVETLLPGQWKTKTWETFKMSEEQLAEFDLQKYIKTPEEDQTELLSPEEVLQKLLPGVTSALPRGLLDIAKEAWEEQPCRQRTLIEHVGAMRERMKAVYPMMREHMETAQRQQQASYNRSAQPREFKPRDRVLVLVPTVECKFLATWQGPYEVIERVGEVNYKVRQPDKRKPEQIYHVNLLKKWHAREALFSCLPPTETKEPGREEVQVGPSLSPHQRQMALELVDRNRDVFSSLPGHTEVVQHEIRTMPGKTVNQRPYRVSEARKVVIQEEVRKMLELGVIEESQSAWASPIVLVPKPDGSVRFCNDYRKLNEVSEFDAYPMPRVDDLIDSLGHARFLTTLDLTKGYWQVPLTPASKEKTAFATPGGLYQYTRLPFGLHGAPATFQRLMDRVLAPHKRYAAAYLDDVVIQSPDWASHLPRVQAVIDSLGEAGLTANPKKCRLAFSETNYLGYTIGRGLVKPQEAKLRAIQVWPRPITKKQVRSFLGLAGYYRRFIMDFATIAAPLTELTTNRHSQMVRWNPEAEAAFVDLKQVLCSSPILVAPDFKKDFIVQADASEVGLGAVLAQAHDGEEHPVLYLSRKLLPREKNYSTMEKECLAVTWALESLRFYLLGRRFTVVSDHAPLQWMARNRETNSRVTRWFLSLQAFNFSVVHRAGKRHGNADALSRRDAFFASSPRRGRRS
ncbi:uncharacterized protein LOC143122160 isoform X4 [Alosa pseudoharengus]|uniref:uncharacterized protein LOC143122160 isoform X4 n=1 Tax=Alosa pseudoharengus TaxID=34774 RepID=UPI003F8CE8B1